MYDLVEDFLQTKRSIQTKRSYKIDLLGFLQYTKIVDIGTLKQYSIPQVGKLALNRLDSYQKLDEHSKRVLNTRTINKKAYTLSSFFQYLVNIHNYPKNPIKVFEKHTTEKHSNTVSLDRGELIDLLQCQRNMYHIATGTTKYRELRNYLILSFLSMSLRRNEVSKLQRQDYDMTAKSIKVFQKGWSYKYIPLPEAIATLLCLYQEQQTQRGYETGYIFTPTKNNSTFTLNKPISTDYIFQLLSSICKKCKISKNITPHSLRKTFIEMSLTNQQDYINIANATGHSTIEMIKYYDTRSKLKNNAINSMGGVFE